MLQLLPMDESDLYAYQTIFAEAFKNHLMALMYPNGYSEEAKKFGIDFSLKEWRSDPERVKMMKVIDTDLPGNESTGKIVGVAKWKFYPRDRTAEELVEEDQEQVDRPWAPGANVPFFKEFFEIIAQCKKKVIGGKAHAILSVLATLPNHHRRGIGAMHMNWGLEQADKVSTLSVTLATCPFLGIETI